MVTEARATDNTTERGKKRRGRGGEKERSRGKASLRMVFFFFSSAEDEPLGKFEKNYSLLQEENYCYYSVQESFQEDVKRVILYPGVGKGEGEIDRRRKSWFGTSLVVQ